jgi:hypothetical protein
VTKITVTATLHLRGRPVFTKLFRGIVGLCFGARYSASTRVGLNNIGLSIVLGTAKSQKLLLMRADRPSARVVT